MKSLRELFEKVAIIRIIGSVEHTIVNQLCIHSSKVNTNSLFVAIYGRLMDGNQFIDEAINHGACVIVCQSIPKKLRYGVNYVEVSDSKEAISAIAVNFYDHTSRKLRLIGVTGTNGKTTIVHLLHDMFMKWGEKSALLSTIHIKIGLSSIVATHTTPNVIYVHSFLYYAVKDGCHYAFMEVSSHVIDQKLHKGLHFFCGIFSNITLEHQDNHRNFKNYLPRSKSFFDSLSKEAFAIANADDQNTTIILKNCKASKYTFGVQKWGNSLGRILEKSFFGMLLDFDGKEFWCRLIGTCNAYNLLSVYATALCIGQEKQKVLKILSKLIPVR